MSIKEFSITKIKNILFLYSFVFIPMWSIFVINNIFLNDSLASFGGIHPREFDIHGFIPIFTSWLLHGSTGTHIYNHILGNSIALVGLLFIIGLIEKNPIKIICLLIVGSGIFTWLLGAPNSVHIGASGLVFALFGYVLSSVLLGKRWIYIIPILFVGGDYFYSLRVGLIPQAGVSFSAHFGGFIAGIVIGYYFGKILATNNQGYVYQKSLKDKIADLKWEIKYFFKSKIKNFRG